MFLGAGCMQNLLARVERRSTVAELQVAADAEGDLICVRLSLCNFRRYGATEELAGSCGTSTRNNGIDSR